MSGVVGSRWIRMGRTEGLGLDLDCPLGATGLGRPQWLLQCRYPCLPWLSLMQSSAWKVPSSPTFRYCAALHPSVHSLVGSQLRLSQVGSPCAVGIWVDSTCRAVQLQFADLVKVRSSCVIRITGVC